MLATTGTLPTDQSAFTFEVKWDGVRAISYIENGGLHVESRNLRDISGRYPELNGLPAALAGKDAVLDGEVVAFDDSGRPSFGRLQSRMHVASDLEVRRRMVDNPVAYLIFDLLWLDGRSLTDRPWTERRAALEDLDLGTGDGQSWKVPTTHPGEGDALLEATRVNGLEGIIAKKMDSVYEIGRRSRCWLKVKHVARQEMVIGGWLPGEGNRENRLGALLVGYYDEGRLRYAGRVGTGFADAELDRLARLLDPLATDHSPFADPVPLRQARFVEPKLVADVVFSEWTAGGTLRHPSYKGLRDDKEPSEVQREPIPGRI